MNPPEPLTDLITAVDGTVKAWGWWGLALIPVAVAAVAIRQVLNIPAPPHEPEVAVSGGLELWEEDGLALWRKFEEANRRG